MLFVIGTILKKTTAAIISLAITISTFFTGNYGEYQKLALKPLTFEDNLLTEISLNLTLSPEALTLISETAHTEKKEFEVSFAVAADKENLRLAFLDDEKHEMLILDSNGLAASSELVTAALSFIDEEFLSVYNKYFPGKNFYADFNELIPYDELSYEDIDYIKEFQESAQIVDFIIELLKSEESLSYFKSFYGRSSGILEKYFVKSEIDGVVGYSCKMDIKDCFEYMKDYTAYIKSEEYIEQTSSYFEYLVSEFSKAYPELLPEADVNIKEEIREELSSFEEDKELIALADALIAEDVDSLGEFAAFLPFFKNSYAEAVIYEKDSVISERTKLVISDGKTEYATFETQVNSMNSEKEIPASEEFAKFENRVTFEQIDCKRAYEKARSEKVSEIEISWVSTMAQNYSIPHISDTAFGVSYLSGDTAYTESSAYLIDGSVYLPLRKILEYAGYDVSWDAENRKAYVIVDAMPVDMTGILIDNKTYVKVRDFEKLGATVDYEESFVYNNAYNDFEKDCYAIIVFED